MVNLSISGPILKCTLRANIGNIDLTIKNINQVQKILMTEQYIMVISTVKTEISGHISDLSDFKKEYVSKWFNISDYYS